MLHVLPAGAAQARPAKQPGRGRRQAQVQHGVVVAGPVERREHGGLFRDQQDPSLALVQRPQHLETFRDGGMHVRPTDVRVCRGGTVSVHNVIEQIVMAGPLGNEVIRILATNVYVKGPIGWQIVMHQAAAAEPASTQAGASAEASSGLLH